MLSTVVNRQLPFQTPSERAVMDPKQISSRFQQRIIIHFISKERDSYRSANGDIFLSELLNLIKINTRSLYNYQCNSLTVSVLGTCKFIILRMSILNHKNAKGFLVSPFKSTNIFWVPISYLALGIHCIWTRHNCCLWDTHGSVRNSLPYLTRRVILSYIRLS